MALTSVAALRKDLRTRADLGHRHLAMVARIIRSIPDTGPGDDNIRWRVTQHFARELRAFNPNFDDERFINACIVEGDE